MAVRSRLHVRVTPAAAYDERARLFEALETSYPIRFDASIDGHPDAAVTFVTDASAPEETSGPTLFLVGQPGSTDRTLGGIRFCDSRLVPRPFRGRTLADSSTPAAPLPYAWAEWGEVLATCPDGPVWSGRAGLQYVAGAWPAELAPGETLREQLTVGRFVGLLPLAHFLREVSARGSWKQPESKACFVFDDPNLHWWSYGYFDYRALSTHAEAHDYRVTAATIPLDQWYIHRGTAEFLRERGSRISFAVHGNNHTRHELRRVEDRDQAATLATQALRRADAVQRAGLEIAPVMVPPHGVCSLAALEGCLRAGFDAVCANWPYWWLAEPHVLSPLSGWHPIDRLGGLPVIPRLHAVSGDLDDIVFRAFLGQPLIIYGHHTDLEAGLEVLAARARDVRSVGVDTWQSLGAIARDVVAAYRDEDTATLTLYSTRSAVVIPEGVSQARFVLPGPDPPATGLRLELSGAGGLREIPVGERVPVNAGELIATIKPVSQVVAPRRGLPAGAVVRRFLTESRDRAAPLASRIRALSRGGRSREHERGH